MKWIAVVLILAVWIHYASGHDTGPVPRWYHPAINLLYAGLLGAVIVWL